MDRPQSGNPRHTREHTMHLGCLTCDMSAFPVGLFEQASMLDATVKNRAHPNSRDRACLVPPGHCPVPTAAVRGGTTPEWTDMQDDFSRWSVDEVHTLVEHVQAVAAGPRPSVTNLLYDVTEDTRWTAEQLLAASVSDLPARRSPRPPTRRSGNGHAPPHAYGANRKRSPTNGTRQKSAADGAPPSAGWEGTRWPR